jgi:hypothetical protein
MPTYLTPGVYIEEVLGNSPAIGAVGTSTAGFLGVAPSPTAPLNEAVACNNLTQFLEKFVGDSTEIAPLRLAVEGFFGEGGSRCYVVNVGKNGSITGDPRKRTGISCFEPIDEIAIVAAPWYCDAASYSVLQQHCALLKDRFAILDAPQHVENIDALKKEIRGGGPAEAPPADKDAAPPKAPPVSQGLRPPTDDSGYSAFYFPWIIVPGGHPCPPSGHMAGIYARTDATRGVHKAPANERIRGAINLTYALTDAEQGELNRRGVNCIRSFCVGGIRVWGARTLADESSQMRYVPVRRLTTMIEESILEGTRGVVFEPNDERLWKNLIGSVSGFLKTLWRDGALKGATQDQAFFVKCDAENNPPESIDAGRLVVDIGIAPVKPAEFIIFRISQWNGAAEVEA